MKDIGFVLVQIRVLRLRHLDGRWQRFYVKEIGRAEQYESRSIRTTSSSGEWPSADSLAHGVLAFSDRRRRGISGKGCVARLVAERARLRVYEVHARIVQA